MTGPLLRLDQFEGPLDLLLRLLESRQLEITEVSLAAVTDQFLAYLEAEPQPDPDQAADFAVIASRLLELKARALLPDAPAAEPEAPEEAEPEVEEPPADLVEQVARYRSFRDAAERLRAWAEERRDLVARAAPERLAPPDPGQLLDGLTLDRLLEAFRTVWQEASRTRAAAAPVHLEPLRLTVREEARRLLELARRLASFPFSACFRSRERRQVVVTFLALLELVQRRQLEAVQEAPGEEILIRYRPAGEADQASEA
ncbi:MAG: ScpA family protein [Bacillota bacterium]|nr:ScpA family protein [Bacillota bacterium]